MVFVFLSGARAYFIMLIPEGQQKKTDKLNSNP